MAVFSARIYLKEMRSGNKKLNSKSAAPRVCHAVGASSEAEYTKPDIRSGDLCIAADGGWLILKKLDIIPDVVVGDFDSSPPPEDIETIRLNPQKDVTDLYAAIQVGKERGYSDFLIYGALGGSWGHSAANLQILAGLAREGFNAAIIAKELRVVALNNGSVTLNSRNGSGVSVLAHGEKAEGVTLEGMRYPLDNAVLDCCFPLGVSNEILEETAKVSVRHGTLLIFQ